MKHIINILKFLLIFICVLFVGEFVLYAFAILFPVILCVVCAYWIYCYIADSDFRR